MVPAWGRKGGGHGPIQQRETEAHNAQQKPSAPLGPIPSRDALTPQRRLSQHRNHPCRKAPMAGGGGVGCCFGSLAGTSPQRSRRGAGGEVVALGTWFPRWQAPFGCLRTAVPVAPSARLFPSRRGSSRDLGVLLPLEVGGNRGVTALWGSRGLRGKLRPPSRLHVSLCPQDHSTQLSRTGTLARKGIKSATQATGTLG